MISVEELAEVANWLSGVSNSALTRAFDPEAMMRADTYDAVPAFHEPKETLMRLEGKITALRTFLQKAADECHPLVRVIA